MKKPITLYLHACKESNYDKARELGLNKEATDAFAGCLYEVKFDCEVDTKTGQTMILAVDGVKLVESIPAN